MSKFFDLGSDEDRSSETLGGGLAKKIRGTKEGPPTPNRRELAAIGARTGFTRGSGNVGDHPNTLPKRGRPRKPGEMTYWRIYVSPSVKAELLRRRDEGKFERLSDLLEHLLESDKSVR